MSDQIQINRDAVNELASLLRDADLTEIEYQVDSVRIKVVRERPVEVTKMQTLQVAESLKPQKNELLEEKLEDHPGVVEAPMVGTVYLSPGPEAKPFVKIGDQISEGQTLFIIEAMKVMNMIKAPKSGMIKHIFVKDAQPVEYGDHILIIE